MPWCGGEAVQAWGLLKVRTVVRDADVVGVHVEGLEVVHHVDADRIVAHLCVCARALGPSMGKKLAPATPCCQWRCITLPLADHERAWERHGSKGGGRLARPCS